MLSLEVHFAAEIHYPQGKYPQGADKFEERLVVRPVMEKGCVVHDMRFQYVDGRGAPAWIRGDIDTMLGLAVLKFVFERHSCGVRCLIYASQPDGNLEKPLTRLLIDDNSTKLCVTKMKQVIDTISKK